MTKNLTLGSLFDGSGGFPLAGMLTGITPIWASEIEPFPIRVTTRRFPFMKHYGDISAMDGGKIEPVDIITFGSPCTDMSVAGKRAGLDGRQSVLFYQAIRIIKEMRKATNGKYPRWICWENVPGAFSSNGGRDFQAVLEAVISVAEEYAEVPMPEKNRWPTADCYMGDGWSVAYRVLDAQHWGVPQRRKRIFLVADFAGQCASRVLFESEGLSRYSAEGFSTWQRATRGASCCSGATGFDGYNGSLTGEVASTIGVNCGMSTGRTGIVLNDQGGNRMDVTQDVTCTLRAEAHHPPCVMEPEDAVALENYPQDSRVRMADDNKVQSLTSRMGTGGNNVPLVMNKPSSIPCNWDGEQVAPTLTAHNAGGNQRMPDKNHFNCVIQAFGICSHDSNAMKSDNPHSGIYEAGTSRTIDGNGGNPCCNQGGIAIVEAHAPETQQATNVFSVTTGSFTLVGKDMAPTVLARDYKDPTAVCYGIGRDTFNHSKNSPFAPTISEELQPPLVAKGPGAIAQPYGFDPSATRDVGQYFLPDCGNTLVNGTCPGHHNGVVEATYMVRRLTPTECARLQGFPDWWCSGLDTPNPTTEDIKFWTEVWETHRSIVSPGTKPKTEKQIIKWLTKPHSDAAEYKMWGNGVALPCVFFVLAGIEYYSRISSHDE